MSKRTATPLPSPAGKLLPHTLCPHCQAEAAITYAVSTRRVLCKACGWAVEVTPVEDREIVFAAVLEQDQSSYLQVLATRCAPLPEPPPTLRTEHDADGAYKTRIVPRKDETPRERLERLADQFVSNGGQLEKVAGYVRATSQWTQADGSPADVYDLSRKYAHGVHIGFSCTCEAGGDPLCAHRAGYWRHLCQRVTEQPTLAPRLQPLIRLIEQQAGIEDAYPAAQTLALVDTAGRYEAAMTDLYGAQKTGGASPVAPPVTVPQHLMSTGSSVAHASKTAAA